jgi:hypothetical protein
MTKSLELLIAPWGDVYAVYSDELMTLLRPKRQNLNVERIGIVEYYNDAPGWWVDLLDSVDGPLIGPFSTRREALEAEQKWLSEHLMALSFS